MLQVPSGFGGVGHLHRGAPPSLASPMLLHALWFDGCWKLPAWLEEPRPPRGVWLSLRSVVSVVYVVSVVSFAEDGVVLYLCLLDGPFLEEEDVAGRSLARLAKLVRLSCGCLVCSRAGSSCTGRERFRDVDEMMSGSFLGSASLLRATGDLQPAVGVLSPAVSVLPPETGVLSLVTGVA